MICNTDTRDRSSGPDWSNVIHCVLLLLLCFTASAVAAVNTFAVMDVVNTSARSYCDAAYLLVGWFVHSFMISRKVKLQFSLNLARCSVSFA